MLRVLLCAAFVLLSPAASQSVARCHDVALVLAVDGSDSVDELEFAFQRAAIAAAFRDPEVLDAIRDAGMVAVAAVFWGDGEFSARPTGWTVLHGWTDAERFAREIEAKPRAVFGSTGIGSGLWAALDLLADPRHCASRSVVNISGDGEETMMRKRPKAATLFQARRRAADAGVTVNALVIADDHGGLAGYYAKHVLVGNDAFVMHILRYEDFAVAIRRKLIRELEPKAVALNAVPG